MLFLACFCASQRVQRRKAELTLASIREKLPNGWADWHQIWHTCANAYGNGYTPNKLPLETQGGGHLGGGGLGGQQLKNVVKLSDWHQLWFTSANSSGNGQVVPQYLRGHGGVGGHKFKSLEKLPSGCADWHRIWTRRRIHLGMDIGYTQLVPQYLRVISGFFRESQIQMLWGSCQTAGPIGTKFGTHFRIRQGMGMG